MVVKVSPQNQRKMFSSLIKKAEERLESAEALYDIRNYSDAISRSYYSFFDTVSALLITKGLAAKTHSGVITLFSLHFIKNELIPNRFARLFRKAKEAREEADYEALKTFSREEAKQILDSAKEFVSYVKKNYKF